MFKMAKNPEEISENFDRKNRKNILHKIHKRCIIINHNIGE